MSGGTQTIQSGDEMSLVLIASGSRTVTKAAGSYTQEDLVALSLVSTKNLVYIYYVDYGDGYLHQSQNFQFDGSGNMTKQTLMNLYTARLRFFYQVYTTALRDADSSVTFYYKIFRSEVR